MVPRYSLRRNVRRNNMPVISSLEFQTEEEVVTVTARPHKFKEMDFAPDCKICPKKTIGKVRLVSRRWLLGLWMMDDFHTFFALALCIWLFTLNSANIFVELGSFGRKLY